MEDYQTNNCHTPEVHEPPNTGATLQNLWRLSTYKHIPPIGLKSNPPVHPCFPPPGVCHLHPHGPVSVKYRDTAKGLEEMRQDDTLLQSSGVLLHQAEKQ